MGLETVLLLGAGFVLLVVGANALVRGAAGIAGAIGVSPLVIGLTVVTFGTASPELAVSLRSALSGQSDLALGNVVGSNIFNILFILGVSSLIAPLPVARQLTRLEVPLLIGVATLLLIMGMDGAIGQLDGVLLFSGMIAYTILCFYQGRKEQMSIAVEVAEVTIPHTPLQLVLQVGMAVIGLGLLVTGAGWLVEGAVTIARTFGVSELVIGLTIVAVGTSLPEVATAIVATIKGERDMAVGNVLGSSLYNILCILGLTSIITPISVEPAALAFDIPVMLTVALACLPIFLTSYRISRLEGGLFLGCYVAYAMFLILDAAQHDAIPTFSSVIQPLALPLIVLMFLVLGLRAVRNNPQLRAALAFLQPNKQE